MQLRYTKFTRTLAASHVDPGTRFSFLSSAGTPPVEAAALSSRLTPLQLSSPNDVSFKVCPGQAAAGEPPTSAFVVWTIMLSMLSRPAVVTALPEMSAVTSFRQLAIASKLRFVSRHHCQGHSG